MALTTESALRKDKRSAKHANIDGMQHRHFAVIAGVLAELVDTYDNPLVKRDVIDAFATKLAQCNPRFDRRRFLKACGVE